VILLDTHALIWVLERGPRLGRRAGQLANRALTTDELATSAITYWEIGLLVAGGRLSLTSTAMQFRQRVQSLGILEIPIGGDVAVEAASLAPALRDPADCLIAATARLHRAHLMTGDHRLLDAGLVDTIDARR